jgi:hypothetical protein
MDIEYQARGVADPAWLLGKAVKAYGHGDNAKVNGWLARLRLSFSEVPFSIAGESRKRKEDDPYSLLRQAQDARMQGQMSLAAGYLDRLNTIFSCLPFISAYSVQEAMVSAGFGRLVLIDTGLDMPGGRVAAE